MDTETLEIPPKTEKSLPENTNPEPSSPPPVSFARKEKKKIIWSGVVLLLLLGAGLLFSKRNTKQTHSITVDGKVIELPISIPESLVPSQIRTATEADINYKINYSFAPYALKNTGFKPSIPDQAPTAVTLTNLGSFEKASKVPFSESQKQALDSDNFFVAVNRDKFWNDDLDLNVFGSNRTDDWTTLYGKIGGGAITERAQENSVFVSSDFLLHIYHRLLEKEFEYVENKKFYPTLSEMTDALFAEAASTYSTLTDPATKASYERILTFFAAPKAILDAAAPEKEATSMVDQKSDTDTAILAKLDMLKPLMSDSAYTKAKEELQLILKAEGLQASPLFDTYWSAAGLSNPQDYSQFTPRSHYTKNSILRSYFRAMMWYGRGNFPITSPELTRDALTISAMTKGTGQLKNWEAIYIPTTFLVGQSEDLEITDYLTAAGEPQAKEITPVLATKVQEAMKSYKSPHIQSSAFAGDAVTAMTKEELVAATKGWRFMGQRFTPDAFIFSTLTQGDEKPDPETGQRLPSTTTGLMVFSALGTKTADPLVNQWITANAPDSDKVIAKNLTKLKTQFAQIPEDIWTQNIYWGWLYTLRSLDTSGMDLSGYPRFVKNEQWNLKNLQTGLGSWTELKHDTLLYAKQSYAELGGGGEAVTPPPVPKGYVEPNIAFLDRLIALTKMTTEGLASRNLLDGVFIDRNDEFLKDLVFFKDIAVKELQNEKISDDDFETLRTTPKYMNALLDALPGEEIHERDARSALIADVHTDVPGAKILYEADGIPNYIYVAVRDQNGTRLTKGLVYNYYEFAAPLEHRLTDQDWWIQNYTTDKSKLPENPAWTQTLVK